jgi:hypothetical protein
MKRTKRFTIRRIALSLAVAAVVVPSAAQAKPTPAKQQPPASVEIPYLSHGVLTPPVDFWNYDPKTGEKLQNTSPGVAPDELARLYGVSEGSLSVDDRSFSKATSVGATPVSASDTGYDVGTGTIGAAGIALMLAVGAGLTIRHSRKTHVSPA